MKSSKEKQLPVKFITEKDPAFRVCHADGVWGMLNSVGNIQLNFFLEHPPMPSSVIFRSDDQGRLRIVHPSDVTVEDGGENHLVTRNFQSAVVVSIDAAKQVAEVLKNFIELAEHQTGSTSK